jgi:hypothetical protein
MSSKPTKQGSLTQDFLRKAADDPDGALATMFMSAFGIALSTLMKIAEEIVKAGNIPAMLMAVTAGVQIRAHVVFVGRDYAGVRTNHPELIIEGARPTQDIYNFGALHALGHIFGHLSPDGLGAKMLKKAGSSITGEYATDSEAGLINQELSRTWTIEDKQEFVTWVTKVQADATMASWVKGVFKVIPTMQTKFNNKATAAAGTLGSTTSAAGAASAGKVPKVKEGSG